jgi:hypothetical protein
MPAADQLARGAALAGLSGGLAWLGWSAGRTSWMLAPIAVGLAGVAALAAWAAAIHLTGGEKFDDHPFI